MGSEQGDSEADEDEFGNPNPLEIPYPYWIARYPVTVAQFGCFVEDGGYTQERWWRTQAAKEWLQENQSTAPRGWDSQRFHPTLAGDKCNLVRGDGVLRLAGCAIASVEW